MTAPPNSKNPIEALRGRILTIEKEVQSGTYRPGPWAAATREIRGLPAAQRRALAQDVTRTSNALHRRAGYPEVSVLLGIGAECAAGVVSIVPLIGGADTQSNALTMAGAALLATVAQPLLKIAVGTLLGVRYAYAFLRMFEPRFKMQYGSYLSRPRLARILYHLCGTAGTPLALAFVSGLAALPEFARMACYGLAVAFAALNAVFFGAALLGFRRIGPVRVSITSGGSAGEELRGA